MLHCRDDLLCFLTLNYHSVSNKHVTDLVSRALYFTKEADNISSMMPDRKIRFLYIERQVFLLKLFIGLLRIKNSKSVMACNT